MVERSDQSPPVASVSARSPTQSGKPADRTVSQKLNERTTERQMQKQTENQVDESIQIMSHYYAYIQSGLGQIIFNFM